MSTWTAIYTVWGEDGNWYVESDEAAITHKSRWLWIVLVKLWLQERKMT